MTKIKKKIQVEAEKAAEEAKKEVYKESKSKKKKEKKSSKYKSALDLRQTKWIEDPLGRHGEAFFDGYKYWITILSPKTKKETIRKVSFVGLTPEQWEERNKKEEENERNIRDT